jgi:hypothetical protein
VRDGTNGISISRRVHEVLRFAQDDTNDEVHEVLRFAQDDTTARCMRSFASLRMTLKIYAIFSTILP